MGSSPKGTSINENEENTEFHQGKIFFSDKYLLPSGQYTSEITKIAQENSVLLCVRAPVGEVNITERKICIGRGLASIKGILSETEFLYHWIKAFKSTLVSKATGTTFVAVTTDVVNNLLIPIPPAAEQKTITDKISALFGYLDSITKSIS